MEKVHVPEGTCGDWRVRRFEVTALDAEGEALHALMHGGRGTPVGTYTELAHRGCIVMSDTPDEMRDHREPAWRATGSVLINGLGLGMLLQAVLAKPEVTDVTVVEIAPEVIQLVGPTYADDPRLTIVQADAFTWGPPKGKRYNMIWHDIWGDICLDNLRGMTRLHRKYGRRCDWQGSWSRDLLLPMQRVARKAERRRAAYWA